MRKLKTKFLLLTSVLLLFCSCLGFTACEDSLVKVSDPYMDFFVCYRNKCPVVDIDFTNKTEDFVLVKDISCQFKGHTIHCKDDIYLEPFETKTCEFKFSSLPFEWDGNSDDMSANLESIGKITWSAERTDQHR